MINDFSIDNEEIVTVLSLIAQEHNETFDISFVPPLAVFVKTNTQLFISIVRFKQIFLKLRNDEADISRALVSI